MNDDLTLRLAAMLSDDCKCVNHRTISEALAAIAELRERQEMLLERVVLLQDLLANRHRLDPVTVAAALNG